MSVSSRTLMTALQNKLAAAGYFPGGVTIGEPKMPPADVAAAVMLGARAFIPSTLTTTIERREFVVRTYINMLREPQEEIDLLLDDVLSKLYADVAGNFRLSAIDGVRRLDFVFMRTTTGYQQIASVLFRISDTIVPFIVDDSASWAP